MISTHQKQAENAGGPGSDLGDDPEMLEPEDGPAVTRRSLEGSSSLTSTEWSRLSDSKGSSFSGGAETEISLHTSTPASSTPASSPMRDKFGLVPLQQLELPSTDGTSTSTLYKALPPEPESCFGTECREILRTGAPDETKTSDVLSRATSTRNCQIGARNLSVPISSKHFSFNGCYLSPASTVIAEDRTTSTVLPMTEDSEGDPASSLEPNSSRPVSTIGPLPASAVLAHPICSSATKYAREMKCHCRHHYCCGRSFSRIVVSSQLNWIRPMSKRQDVRRNLPLKDSRHYGIPKVFHGTDPVRLP